MHSVVNDKMRFQCCNVVPYRLQALLDVLNLVSAVFFFLAFLVYVKAVNESNVLSSWVRVAVCVVLAACSMLSKEPGITVLGMCIGYDILSHWQLVWDGGKNPSATHNGSVKLKESTGWNFLKGDVVQLAHMSKRIGTCVLDQFQCYILVL